VHRSAMLGPMLIAWASLLVAIVGLLIYAFAKDAKLSEAGRLLFFCGAFWFVYALAGKTLRIG
jgi:Na+/phosphate symporter